MSFIITDESINKLLFGRAVLDEFNPLIEEFPEKSSYKINREFELSKLGFIDLKSFYLFNDAHNVVELDNTYCVKPVRDLTETAPQQEDFCFAGGACVARGLPTCLIGGKDALTCFFREPVVKDVLPFDESKLVKFQRYSAIQVGFTDLSDLLTIHPLAAIACKTISPQYLTPPRCIGAIIKDSEPRFDVFWGMEKFFKWAEFQHVVRENLIDAG